MFKLGLRGSDELHIDLDEDTPKAKCEKHPHGFPIEKVNGSDACLVVYKGNGEKLDDNVVLDNISEGEVTLRDKETGETQDYNLE